MHKKLCKVNPYSYKKKKKKKKKLKKKKNKKKTKIKKNENKKQIRNSPVTLHFPSVKSVKKPFECPI